MKVEEKRRAKWALVSVLTLLTALLLGMALSVNASAQTPCDPYAQECEEAEPTTLPGGDENEDTDDEEVLPTEEEDPDVSPSGDNRLPTTGADLTLYLATGLAAISTGGVIVRRTRFKRPEDQDKTLQGYLSR